MPILCLYWVFDAYKVLVNPKYVFQICHVVIFIGVFNIFPQMYMADLLQILVLHIHNIGKDMSHSYILNTYTDRCVMYMLLHIHKLQTQKWHLHMIIVYFTFCGHAKCGICLNHMWSLHILWKNLHLQKDLFPSHTNYSRLHL